MTFISLTTNLSAVYYFVFIKFELSKYWYKVKTSVGEKMETKCVCMWGEGQTVCMPGATESIEPVLLTSYTRACNFGLRVITHFLE